MLGKPSEKKAPPAKAAPPVTTKTPTVAATPKAAAKKKKKSEAEAEEGAPPAKKQKVAEGSPGAKVVGAHVPKRDRPPKQARVAADGEAATSRPMSAAQQLPKKQAGVVPM